jgi:hypothetical protein
MIRQFINKCDEMGDMKHFGYPAHNRQQLCKSRDLQLLSIPSSLSVLTIHRYLSISLNGVEILDKSNQIGEKSAVVNTLSCSAIIFLSILLFGYCWQLGKLPS